MGIKGLTKLLADNAPKAMREQKFESYFGRKVAIDASMSIYQFLIVVGRQGTEMLTNEAGEVTSHLQGMFTRTVRLLESGLKPVYVFDGAPPDLKKEELKKRYSRREDATENLAQAEEAGNVEDVEKYSKRSVRVSKQHNADCLRLLRLMGVPVVELLVVVVLQAPSEAEAECANLCRQQKVFAVASEDMDSLTFGAPVFLRHLMEPSTRKIPVMEFEIDKVLEELQLSMGEFVDMCILCGCDYCDTIRGIGPQTALKLIRQHKSIEAVLENLNKDRCRPLPSFRAASSAAGACLAGPGLLGSPALCPLATPGLKKFLVEENGFNHERVTKTRVFLQADGGAGIRREEKGGSRGEQGGGKGRPGSKKGQGRSQGGTSQEEEVIPSPAAATAAAATTAAAPAARAAAAAGAECGVHPEGSEGTSDLVSVSTELVGELTNGTIAAPAGEGESASPKKAKKRVPRKQRSSSNSSGAALWQEEKPPGDNPDASPRAEALGGQAVLPLPVLPSPERHLAGSGPSTDRDVAETFFVNSVDHIAFS
eukprot:jgi/Mesen1/4746/ME000242S03921